MYDMVITTYYENAVKWKMLNVKGLKRLNYHPSSNLSLWIKGFDWVLNNLLIPSSYLNVSIRGLKEINKT